METDVSTDRFTDKSDAAVDDSPVFYGTNVLVEELHSYMREDWNLYGFLHKFPSVSMEQALAEMEKSARATAKRVIQCNAEIADGTPVFERTEVPVKRMFEYLADVRSLKDFHWDYPAVFRADAYDAVVTSCRILELDAYREVENGVVHSDVRIVSGSPIFVDSRMPIRIVFDHLATGETLKDFHYHYDTGTKEHLIPVVNLAWKAIEREFHAAAS